MLCLVYRSCTQCQVYYIEVALSVMSSIQFAEVALSVRYII